MANTRDTMGEQACLDALVADTLTSFEDDGVTKVGKRCLYKHSTLTSVTLPQCKSIDEDGLANCSNLTLVDIQGTGTIGISAFYGDKQLRHFIMRGATKSALSAGSFSISPINIGEGAIYVDPSLLAAYKADSNWNKYFITTLDKYPLSDFSTITESWAELDAMTQEQIAAKYEVGDSKLLDLGAKGQVYAQIAGFGHDELVSGGKAKVTFVLRRILENKVMNQSSSTVSKWETTTMRSYLASDVLPLMPSDLQSALKEVKKYSFGYTDSSTSSTDTETTDKLFILSTTEVGVTSGNCETKAAKYDIFSDDNSRVKFAKISGEADYWWLRTAYSNSAFYRVTSNGSTSNKTSSSSYGVVLGFCI